MQTSQSLNLVRAGYSLPVRSSLAAEVQPLSGDAKGSGRVSLPNGYRPNFRTRPKNGIGSRCFPPQVITSADRQEKTADIISMKPLCNGV